MPIPTNLRVQFLNRRLSSADGDLQPEAPSSPKPQVSSPRARAAVAVDPQSMQSSSFEGPSAGSFSRRHTRSMTEQSKTSSSTQPSQPSWNTSYCSQRHFHERDQTAIVFDFDDTLFPTTFADHLSEEFENDCLSSEKLKDFLSKIEECQVSAEALIHCAQKLGHVIIVTLCSRALLKKRCATWFSRVWKLMLNDVQVVYARESEAHQDNLDEFGKLTERDETLEYWAWVKGTVIEQELDRLYSQYEGQTWKNVLSIGDSNIERYGTLGASNAYVQKRFSGLRKAHQTLQQRNAYAIMWENFDSRDRDWRGTLEGVHDGHTFKVRIKVVKMLEEPTPMELSQEQMLLSRQLFHIVTFDGSLNLLLDDLQNVKTSTDLFSRSGDLRQIVDDENHVHLAFTARALSKTQEFTKLTRMGTSASMNSKSSL
eukprot:gnl/MRDRNA2_/MRDRNA2_84184_c0_seq1.p1 gnl/MRDRNA2_/MRDRNA2_84184_c0~~gnl/MRDRNA2_/MRDRNA2_84184_c0_seq1.p1  ORF type:complete len:427 (+),score=51.46 gnl/MRDRNA2_/MRDRNA2_84184_c0_seq1:77-1357(+)